MDSKLRCAFEIPLENDKTVSMSSSADERQFPLSFTCTRHILSHVASRIPHITEVCRPMLVILYAKEWSHIQTFILHVLFQFGVFFISLISTHHHNHPRRADLFISDCLCCSSHSLPCVCMSLPPLLSLFSPPPPTPSSLPPSLRSMRAKATKLCPPLPPLLRPSTRHCPSRPAPRWTTARWRRSWRSASGCRWRCRGYGKKTNRSGWDFSEQKDTKCVSQRCQTICRQ